MCFYLAALLELLFQAYLLAALPLLGNNCIQTRDILCLFIRTDIIHCLDLFPSPPALEVDLSPAWTRRWSFPRITNVNHTWLPCNNITRILLAFFFFFWPFLPENSLTWWQKYFIFCLIVSYLSLTSDQHLPLRQGCGLQWQLFLIFYLWLSWFVCIPYLTNLVCEWG